MMMLSSLILAMIAAAYGAADVDSCCLCDGGHTHAGARISALSAACDDGCVSKSTGGKCSVRCEKSNSMPIVFNIIASRGQHHREQQREHAGAADPAERAEKYDGE